MRKRRKGPRAGNLTVAKPEGEMTGALTALGQRLALIEEAVREVQRGLQSQSPDKEWYTTAELAVAMGVSQYTVQERWCNQGRIEAVKNPDSGKWRIPAREFQRVVRGWRAAAEAGP